MQHTIAKYEPSVGPEATMASAIFYNEIRSQQLPAEEEYVGLVLHCAIKVSDIIMMVRRRLTLHTPTRPHALPHTRPHTHTPQPPTHTRSLHTFQSRKGQTVKGKWTQYYPSKYTPPYIFISSAYVLKIITISSYFPFLSSTSTHVYSLSVHISLSP